MITGAITREEILAVYPKVAQIMADALGCDVEQVELGVSLIEGLNAESIDFLDIVFGLERAFKVKIPRGKIMEDARGDLPEAEFEEKGHLTERGLQRRDAIHEREGTETVRHQPSARREVRARRSCRTSPG